MARQTLFNYGVVDIRGEAYDCFLDELTRVAREGKYETKMPPTSYAWNRTAFAFEIAGMRDGSLMAEADKWFRLWERRYQEGDRGIINETLARLETYQYALKERGLLLPGIGDIDD